jgi:hypothetical protein
MQNTSKLQSFIDKYDFFGAPISLMLKGKRTYQTIYGATYTLIAIAILIFFVILQVTTEVYKWHPTLFSTHMEPITDDFVNANFYLTGAEI